MLHFAQGQPKAFITAYDAARPPQGGRFIFIISPIPEDPDITEPKICS